LIFAHGSKTSIFAAMSTKSDPNVNWAETLARFLSEQPGVEAVRIDAGSRKISVATLGEVDQVQLQARLAETMKAVEDKLASAAEVPAGFAVRQEGKLTEMAGLTCSTAASMWKWREYEWPPINAEIEEIEEPEWRELAVFASVCGLFGIAGFVVEKMGVGPAWLAHALYGVALIAGGWDATIDTWENLREKKLDIHFLMLAVAVGAVCIGAWGEAVLLLFLFSSSGAMEDYAMDRTQREVGSLLKTAPKQATVVRSDGREELLYASNQVRRLRLTAW